jgi:hypothetical protein
MTAYYDIPVSKARVLSGDIKYELYDIPLTLDDLEIHSYDPVFFASKKRAK